MSKFNPRCQSHEQVLSGLSRWCCPLTQTQWTLPPDAPSSLLTLGETENAKLAFFLSLVKPSPGSFDRSNLCAPQRVGRLYVLCGRCGTKKNNFVFSSAAHHLFILTKHFCCNRPQSPLLLNWLSINTSTNRRGLSFNLAYLKPVETSRCHEFGTKISFNNWLNKGLYERPEKCHHRPLERS